MMNKRNRIILLITIVVIVGIKILNLNNLYIFFGVIDQKTILCGLYVVLFIVFFSMLKGNLFTVRFILILTIILLSILTIRNFRKSQEEVYIFDSPDATNSILIKDSEFTHYYFRKVAYIYESLKVDFAGSSIHSFKDNHYSVIWTSNDVVEVKYLLFGKSTYFNIVFDLNNTDRLHEGTIIKD